MEQLAGLGFEVFLDLKFHDIPSTVAGAVAAAALLPGVRLLTLHTAGGAEMMRAAWKAAARAPNPPRLLGVTLLTSLSVTALRQIGFPGTAETHAVRLAKLAQRASLDGVVASSREAAAIRKACGKNFLIVVPGIRASKAKVQDQARVAGPTAAMRAGADYLVIGRPITEAPDPALAARGILDEMASASARRR